MSQLSSIVDLHAPAEMDILASALAAQTSLPAGFDAVFPLSGLDGSNGFRLEGGFTYGSAGGAVASAGDVNGDGFADLIVGANRESPNGGYSGAAYVIYGSSGGFEATLQLADLKAAQGFKLEGAGDFDHAGAGVSSAGDFNGDGIDDFIVGAVGESEHGDYAGSTYVIFGRSGGFAPTVDLADINGHNGFRLDGEGNDDFTGQSVASIGDFNGDGFDDILIGGSGSDINGDYFGAGYVVFGRASGFRAATDLAALKPSQGFRIDGTTFNYGSPWSVSGAGDVNGDDFDDLILGALGGPPDARGAGSSYVIFGDASGFGKTFDLADLDGTNGFRIDGEAAYDNSGRSVSSAGDVNGDGFADLIIGAPGRNYSGDAGASYVVFGKASGFAATLDLSDLNGHNGFKIQGGVSGQYSGYSVASAGDFNGDGFADLIIGAPSTRFQSTPSASYVVFGQASGFGAILNLSTLDGSDGFRIAPEAATDELGMSVSSAGDLNGDGLDDLVVGAPSADPNGDRSGSSYVIFGQLPTKAVRYTGTDASQSLVGGELKDSLSGMGGDDMLWGHGGKDKLTGGVGNDTLIGGTGKDVLIGSAGADVFQYRELADSTVKAHDLIKGVGKTDVIDLHLIDADAGAKGDQAFTLVSSFSHHAGELTVSFDGKQTLVEGDVNGDGTADLVIAISGDHHDFTNFVL